MVANHCSVEYLHIVNYVRAGSFVLSFVTCLLVMVLWICSAYHNPNRARWTESSLFYTAERLPFYVLIIATIHSFVSMAQLTTLIHNKNKSTARLCTAVAFFSTLTETSMLLISIIAPAHLLLINCKKTSEWLQDERKRRPRILEVGYIVTITIGSMVAASVPFLCLPFSLTCYGYDPEGKWCWITARDNNCVRVPAGWGMQIALFFTPTFIAFFLVLVVLGHICVIKCSKKCPSFILRLLPDQRDQGFTRPMIALTSYLFFFSVCNVISFGIRINRIPNKIDAIVLSFGHSLWGFLPSIVVGFLLFSEWKERGRNEPLEDSVSDYGSIQRY